MTEAPSDVVSSHLCIVVGLGFTDADGPAFDLAVHQKATSMTGLGGMQVGIHLRAGATVPQIARLASEVHADLVVIGSHRGPHLRHWLVGAKAEGLIAKAGCPVLVAPPRPCATALQEPTIEPPCPDCIRARAASHGAQPFAFDDSEVIPTGTD